MKVTPTERTRQNEEVALESPHLELGSKRYGGISVRDFSANILYTYGSLSENPLIKEKEHFSAGPARAETAAAATVHTGRPNSTARGDAEGALRRIRLPDRKTTPAKTVST